MTFDPTKPVQTRGGSKARIICTDAGGKQPIVALISDDKAHEFPEKYGNDGSFFTIGGHAGHDLINIPERRVLWANVYEHGTEGRLNSRTAAEASARAGRLGVLKLTYENYELVDHEYEKLK